MGLNENGGENFAAIALFQIVPNSPVPSLAALD